MKKGTSFRRHPLFQGNSVLTFDEYSEEEISHLTVSQKQDKFVSQWVEHIDPVERYKNFFNRTKDPVDVVMKKVKNFYKRYVVENDWREQKYALVLDHIFQHNMALYPTSFDNVGKLYEQGRLISQQKAKKFRKRI